MVILILLTHSLTMALNGRIETVIRWIVEEIIKLETIPIYSLTTLLNAEILTAMAMVIILQEITVMHSRTTRHNGLILTAMAMVITMELAR